jgi:hypothetical protein
MLSAGKISIMNPAGAETKNIALIHHSYYILLSLQTSVFVVTSIVWSRSIYPVKISSSQLRMNIQNWKQYGTWIGTFFGAIGISVGVFFITNTTEFGSLFVRHILVLFGAGIVLNISFVVNKIYRMERKLVECSNVVPDNLRY